VSLERKTLDVSLERKRMRNMISREAHSQKSKWKNKSKWDVFV